MNSDEIAETYLDYIHSQDCSINISETITPHTHTETGHDGEFYTMTTWENEKIVEITNYPDRPSFEETADLPKRDPIQKGSILEIHQAKVYKILKWIAQNELHFPTHPYQKKYICKGHRVCDNLEVKKSGDLRKKVRDLSETIIRKYETDLQNYKKCVTHTTGLDDHKQKVRFTATVYHVDDHKNCNCFETQFFTTISEKNQEPILLSSQNAVKRCLGHAEHLFSLPQKKQADQILRQISDQKLKEYESLQNIKGLDEGYLKTHTFQRQTPQCIWNDLFIFYQHKDNDESCSQCCFTPLLANRKQDELTHDLSPQNQPTSLASNDLNSMPSHLKRTTDFLKGMAKGAIRGGKEALVNLAYIGVELVKDPLNQLDSLCEGLRELSQLALTDQWAQLCETLSPEACKLAEEWNNLSSEERGELYGYAVAKLGVDFIVPVKAAKLAAKGVKGANKILEVSQKMNTALEPALNGKIPSINQNTAIKISEKIPSEIIFGEGNFTIEKLLEAGKVIDREGLTKAGRGLAKHGGREVTAFPRPTGSPSEINIQGQQILEKILNHPEKNIVHKLNARYGEFVDVRTPIGGMRFSAEGDLVGFLEPN